MCCKSGEPFSGRCPSAFVHAAQVSRRVGAGGGNSRRAICMQSGLLKIRPPLEWPQNVGEEAESSRRSPLGGRTARIMDSVAIAKAVQAEIERQQTDVVYSDLSVAELEDVIKHLSSRLDLCKQALAEKQGGAAAAPKMVAQKATGSWPELPWTDRAPLPAALPHTVAQGRRTLKLRVPLPLLQLLPASRMRTRSPSTSPSRCANASWSSMVPWAPPSSSTSSPRRTSAVREPSDGPHGQPPGMAAAAAELCARLAAGDKFTDVPATQELKGNNDLLVFTQPDTIREIHRCLRKFHGCSCLGPLPPRWPAESACSRGRGHPGVPLGTLLPREPGVLCAHGADAARARHLCRPCRRAGATLPVALTFARPTPSRAR